MSFIENYHQQYTSNFLAFLEEKESENEIGVMISITGAKEWPGKIKQVTSVYVQ